MYTGPLKNVWTNNAMGLKYVRIKECINIKNGRMQGLNMVGLKNVKIKVCKE